MLELSQQVKFNVAVDNYEILQCEEFHKTIIQLIELHDHPFRSFLNATDHPFRVVSLLKFSLIVCNPLVEKGLKWLAYKDNLLTVLILLNQDLIQR
jgi:hypothetical protein